MFETVQSWSAAVRDQGVIGHTTRGALADTLPLALASVFDMADLLGLDVGSLARESVQVEFRPRAPEHETDSGGPGPLTDPREPAFVDGHPWTKRDEIAQALLIAGRTPKDSLAAAAMLLAQRNQLNRLGADGAPADFGVTGEADPAVTAWRADREKRRESMPEVEAPPLAPDGGPIVQPFGAES